MRKKHEINMNMRVHGVERYIAIKTIFDGYFAPKDGVYMADTPEVKLATMIEPNDVLVIWIDYTAERKYTVSQIDAFRMFLNGILATLEYSHPRPTINVVV